MYCTSKGVSGSCRTLTDALQHSQLPQLSRLPTPTTLPNGMTCTSCQVRCFGLATGLVAQVWMGEWVICFLGGGIFLGGTLGIIEST